MTPVRRRARLAAAVTIGAALAAIAITATRGAHEQMLASELEDIATSRFRVYEVEVSRALELPRTVSALHDAGLPLDAAHLVPFLDRALAWHPEADTVATARVVSREGRAGYETAIASSRAGFQVTELGEGAGFVRAGDRSVYVVFDVVAPGRNAIGIGFDFASTPDRRLVLERARDAGDVALSPLIAQVLEGHDRGVRVVAPLRHAGAPRTDVPPEWSGVDGFVVEVIFPQALLERAVPRSQAEEIVATVRDLDDRPGGQLLAAAGNEPAQGDLAWSRDIREGGRTWRFEARPTAAFFAARRDRLTPAVAASCALLIVLVTWGLHRAQMETRRVQELVTDRTQALATTTARLEAILDAATGVAIVATDAKGRVLLANTGARRMLGVAAGAPGLTIRDIHEEPRLPGGHEALMRGTGEFTEERTWRRTDGSLVRVECSVTELPDPRGGASGALLVATDASRRREEEAALRRARDAAEATSRAKSHFLARMSHELRTPLNSVIGLSGILAKNRPGTGSPRDLLLAERIRENGLHLLSLIDDILDISKIEEGRVSVVLAHVDIVALAREVAAELGDEAAARGLALRVDAPESVMALSDATRLRQVLTNLVGNALKFTPAGSVEIRVRRGEPEAYVEVQDTGIGISGEQLPRIFEPFAQVEDALTRHHGGSGLGLAISRSLCDIMGHRLDVSSSVGRGSTFRVVLTERVNDRAIADRAG